MLDHPTTVEASSEECETAEVWPNRARSYSILSLMRTLRVWLQCGARCTVYGYIFCI